MKRFSLLVAILIMMTALSALAAPPPNTATVPAFPGTLANAQYSDVTLDLIATAMAGLVPLSPI